MAIDQFLFSIQESGHVLVGTDEPKPDATVEKAIRDIDAVWRNDLAYDAPVLSMPAAVWAATQMYRACQFLIFREIEATILEKYLADPCPQSPAPSICYSADLSFRLLPELVNLARGLSEDDPLVRSLMTLCRAWPLSSVGVANVGLIDIDTFIEDRCLRRLYVDRIIERNDQSRLGDPRVADVARETLGAYPELAPSIAKAVGISAT